MITSSHISTDDSNGAAESSFYFAAFLESAGRTRTFGPTAVVFSQGDSAANVMYLLEGTVKKTVMSRDGKEAVVGVLGPGDFLGEECLAGSARRLATATTLSACRLQVVDKQHMLRLLHEDTAVADWFLSRTLARLSRIEDDLADQLFNPSEKRLARTLLLLGRYGSQNDGERVLPNLSQTMLAEMVGTTRSRVNFFMNKFKKLGFIDYDDESLTITSGLAHMVEDDEPAPQLHPHVADVYPHPARSPL